MSFFTGGGPLTEHVRTVYCQIRKSVLPDPDAILAVDGFAKEQIPNHTDGAVLRLEKIQREAEELRRAFNRKHFFECNMSIFNVEDLEKAARQYEAAKYCLQINPQDRLKRTELNDIYVSLQRRIEKNRFGPFLWLSVFVGKVGAT